jgi:ribosome-associated protein
LAENLSALDIARKAGLLAIDKKGLDIRILTLEGLSTVCDYFVIVSGEADMHVKAIAEAIDDGLAREGIKPLHREGMNEGNWVLLDYIDVVVHVFYEPTRRFYALERLWGDAPVEVLDDSDRSTGIAVGHN